MPATPPVGRWSRRSGDRPAEITRAALAQFAGRGFAATKLEDVARAAGISKGTIYLYFNTKEDLFRAVVRQELLPNLADLEALAANHTGPAETLLRAMAERFRQVIDSDAGAIPKLILSEAGNFPDLARFYADEVVARGMRLFETILRQGIARGEFRPIDPTTVLPVFVGPVLVMLLWKHSVGRHADVGFDPKAVLDTHIGILLRGLAPDPAP